MFILDLNPRGSVRKEKLPVASFQHRAAQTGTVALRRSASYKYAKQTVKSVYQLHLKKNTIFGVLFYFCGYIRLEPERVCAKRKVAFCKKLGNRRARRPRRADKTTLLGGFVYVQI